MAKEKKELNLVDISVDDKNWRAIRREASAKELLIMGLGSKYRVGTYTGKALLFSFGLVASLAIGLPLFFLAKVELGLIIAIVGYIAFSFLATKFGRYCYTFDQIRSRLPKEYKEALDGEMTQCQPNGFLSLLINFILIYLTLPFQAIMILLSMVVPNFVTAKNGILITVPKGCDLDNVIGAVGYYESEDLLAAAEFFLDDYEKESYKKSHKYQVQIKGEYGETIKLHSADNVTFYDDFNNRYESDDQGKHVRKVK